MIKDEHRKWWILIAMGTVGGLFLLDETVVGVALPSIRHDLGMSQTLSHWVISAYFLVFTAFAAVSGKMGDRIGFRNVVLIGCSAFGVGSLACGFAEQGAVLIAARAVQGFGAAVLFPATIAMVTIVFPKEQRGMAIGVFAAITTSFLSVGPVLGGVLTEFVSWQWIFWINVPLVVAIIVIVMLAWVDLPRESEQPRLDYGGLITLVASLGMIIFGVMQGASWGWTQPAIVGLLVGGVIALVLFVIIENKTAEPLIEVDLFRSVSFSASTLVLFTGQYCKLSIVVFGALYLQDALGMSPLMAGLAILVPVAGFPFLSGPCGKIADKHGARKPVLVGLTVATAAMVWIGLTASRDSYWWLLPGFIGWGLGMPFCYVPVLRLVANSVPKEKQGQTSGIAATARLLGGTFGVSISSTLLVGTDRFDAVFLVTAGIMFVTLVIGALGIEHQSPGKEGAARENCEKGLGGEEKGADLGDLGGESGWERAWDGGLAGNLARMGVIEILNIKLI
ncbi:MAG: MFS transporter [Verrucomicrobiota bacterium]